MRVLFAFRPSARPCGLLGNQRMLANMAVFCLLEVLASALATPALRHTGHRDTRTHTRRYPIWVPDQHRCGGSSCATLPAGCPGPVQRAPREPHPAVLDGPG